MKRFLLSLLYLVLPVLILAYPLDLLLSRNLKKSKSYAQKEFSVWNDIFESKANSDIIIHGSSRAWMHFNPLMIGDSLHCKAYNLGLDGHNFWLQYLRYNLFLKYNAKPKLIIYSLDIFTLMEKEKVFNEDQFLPYMLWNNEIKDAIIGYSGYNYYDFKIPFLRYMGKHSAINESLTMLVKGKDNNVTRIRGYEGQNEEWNDDFDKVKNKLQKLTIEFSPATIKLFDKFINECIAGNTELVFVYSPEYIEGQKFVENRDEIFKHFSFFSKKYNIPIYDFSSDSICFNKKYFLNAIHLNKTGSELFTKKLIDSLKVRTQKTGLPKWGSEVENQRLRSPGLIFNRDSFIGNKF